MSQPDRSESQDPSMDLENVNAAYRVQYELANHYGEALVDIVEVLHEPESRRIAARALTFDPLSREQS